MFKKFIALAAITIFIFGCSGSDAVAADDNLTASSSSQAQPSSSSSSSSSWSLEEAIGSMTDSRDGLVYKTVTIGTQTWMAENLNYKTNSSYCYEDNAGNCGKYGRLYEWFAAMDACPTGWHLPSDEEWKTLWTAVGGTSTAGQKLKSTSGWYDGGNGADSFGFAVLPAGDRDLDGNFDYEGSNARFWSSTESIWSSTEINCYGANYWYFCYDCDSVGVWPGLCNLNYGFSVRCLRDSDEGNEASSPSIQYGSLTDSRDGQVYKTVTIGTQTWMTENLNYAYTGVKYNYDGYTSDSTSWCYDNKASNCDKYGRLYTWSAVMDSAGIVDPNGAGRGCGYGVECKVTEFAEVRGVCPEGWHVPTNEEFSTLYTYIGGSSIAGLMLKSTSGWYDSGNGSDKYGFSVLPTGGRSYDGSFYDEGYYADLWSASEYNSYGALDQYFLFYDVGASLAYNFKSYGRSLRCLKD